MPGRPPAAPQPLESSLSRATRHIREATFTAPFCVFRTFLRWARTSKNYGFGWVWWQNLIIDRLGPNWQHWSGPQGRRGHIWGTHGLGFRFLPNPSRPTALLYSRHYSGFRFLQNPSKCWSPAQYPPLLYHGNARNSKGAFSAPSQPPGSR